MIKPVNEKTERVLTELAEASEKFNTTLLSPEKGYLSTLWCAMDEIPERLEIEATAQAITGVTSTSLYDFAEYARNNGFDTLADSFTKSADMDQTIVAACPKYETPLKWYNNTIRMCKDIKAIKKLGTYTQS